VGQLKSRPGKDIIVYAYPSGIVVNSYLPK
jgi:hypothetical protein